MNLLTVEDVIDLFPEKISIFVTFTNKDKDVWLSNEEVMRPYPSQNKEFSLPTIRIASKGVQEFYTDFPVETALAHQFSIRYNLELCGPKGLAQFRFGE